MSILRCGFSANVERSGFEKDAGFLADCNRAALTEVKKKEFQETVEVVKDVLKKVACGLLTEVFVIAPFMRKML